MAKKVVNLYEILGVKNDATAKEISKAYRALSKTHHPDVSKEENAHEIFQEIHEAYVELSNPESRKQYDDFYEEESKKNEEYTFEHIFSAFHTHVVKPHLPIRGEDIELEVPFCIEDIKQQRTLTVSVERFINCRTCEGANILQALDTGCEGCSGKGFKFENVQTPFGSIKREIQCPDCSGVGYTDAQKCPDCKEGKHAVTYQFKVAVGDDVTDGHRMRVAGKGDEGVNGGAHGDLHLVFALKDEDYEIVHEYDLQTKINVPFVTTLTGGDHPMLLPSGEVAKVPIVKGTQSGHKVIVPGEGLYMQSTEKYGDLYATVNILVPDVSPDKVKQIVSILQ
ncbi:DnaJ C-terminal domain-containing protein [Priestia megaterium]